MQFSILWIHNKRKKKKKRLNVRTRTYNLHRSTLFFGKKNSHCKQRTKIFTPRRIRRHTFLRNIGPPVVVSVQANLWLSANVAFSLSHQTRNTDNCKIATASVSSTCQNVQLSTTAKKSALYTVISIWRMHTARAVSLCENNGIRPLSGPILPPPPPPLITR